VSSVGDVRNGLKIWKVVANVLNKQSRTADMGWYSSLGVERGTNNSSPIKKKTCNEALYRAVVNTVMKTGVP
jgi:hypothetical protein